MLLLFPIRLEANIGLPTLIVAWPGLFILLAPIVLLEAAYGRRVFGIAWRHALRFSFRANAISASLGVPIAWALMFGVGFVAALLADAVDAGGTSPLWTPLWTVLGAAWIVGEGPLWELPAALAVLCIPFYFASVVIEARVAREDVPNAMPGQVMRWSRGANLLSYGSIFVGLVGTATWLFGLAPIQWTVE